MKHSRCAAVVGTLLVGLWTSSFPITAITQPIATSFGTYTPDIQSITPTVPPYKVPDGLNGVLFADQYVFSDSVKNRLIQNGFAAVPSPVQTMTAIYKDCRAKNLPAFVTVDMPLHCFYKTYDNMLKIAEYNQFHGELDSMLHGMLAAVVPLRSYTGNDSLVLAVKRAAAYLDVAHTLLTDTITFAGDAAVRSMVMAETSLVYAHQGFDSSKVVAELVEDFSQYVPRGHYTLDTRFEHYFRAMMYLGRMNLRVQVGTDSTMIEAVDRMETMQACVLARLLATARIDTVAAAALWEKIYNPTTFFVGRSDDLNFLQYAQVLDKLLGSTWRTGDIGVLYSRIGDIVIGLRALPAPMILSGLGDAPQKGFRLMGQRFVPDSYVFGQLVFKYVGTVSRPRLFPRGLDFMAVMGSSRARQHLIELYHDDAYANYVTQLDSLTKSFAVKPASQWCENLYWNWIYTLSPLLKTPDAGYPMFMTTQAWADKSLTSASGSWAELRHASILYAKQSYTGTVGMNCPYPHRLPQGYVEPNPEVFGRLASLAAFMKNGFEAVGLSPILPVSKLTALSTLCNGLRDIARSELQGEPITMAQYSDIANADKVVTGIEDFSAYRIPPSTQPSPGSDSSIALIVDVHTDPNTQKVLEVGEGRPMSLYVVVPVEGKLQVCQGAMFSYFEFTHPMDDRLTDASWQGMLANSTNPPMPLWTKSFAESTGPAAPPYKNDEEDRTVLLYGNDSIPKTFVKGRGFIALVQSDTLPMISVEANGATRVFSGTALVNGRYEIVIPASALGDTNILTVSSRIGYGSINQPCGKKELAGSYRTLVVGLRPDAVHGMRPNTVIADMPRLRGATLEVPLGQLWRIVDMRGRAVATVGPKTGRWIAPPGLRHVPLILVAAGNREFRPRQFIVGD